MMTRIKVCVSDALSDPDYVYKTEMRKMISEVNEFTDTAQTEIQNTVLKEMKRLFDTGACGFTPPVCGLLTRIGYFDKPAILDSAIGYLEHRLGIEGWRWRK
jgi:Fe-S-cluster formation regulator IscX/YfhJ